jgi:hypothetical protein
MWWLARIWLPIAVATTVLSLVLFAAVQQNYRQSQSDPQIQMAEDGALALASGGVPAGIVPRGLKVDVAQSLSPWIAVYDSAGVPLESTGVSNNAPPKLPIGLLEIAKDPDQNNRVTWESSTEARQALVIVYVPKTDQYVVAGRNMREAEARIWQMQTLVLLGWLFALAATLVASWVAAKFNFQSHIFATTEDVQ